MFFKSSIKSSFQRGNVTLLKSLVMNMALGMRANGPGKTLPKKILIINSIWMRICSTVAMVMT